MSAHNPNVRRQRRFAKNTQRRIDALNAMLAKAGKPPLSDEDVARVRADAARAALAESNPPVTRTVADRRAKRARRHEAVKAMFKAAGVALPEDKAC